MKSALNEQQLDDRFLQWCGVLLVVTILLMAGAAWWAVHTNGLGAYMKSAAFIYFAASVFFLAAITIALIGGHVGSSDVIEAPKIELFELEEKL